MVVKWCQTTFFYILKENEIMILVFFTLLRDLMYTKKRKICDCTMGPKTFVVQLEINAIRALMELVLSITIP